MEAIALERARAGRSKLTAVAIAMVAVAVATLLCLCAAHQRAYAAETYTVTFGDTGHSYQVPAGKTLADVKGASIPKLADTTYVYAGPRLQLSDNKLKATFLGWACKLATSDGQSQQLDTLKPKSDGAQGRFADGSGSGDDEIIYCGVIDWDCKKKALYSRDGWRNRNAEPGYEPLSLSTKITSDMTVWAVYSIPLSHVEEVEMYHLSSGKVSCSGTMAMGFVKTGERYKTSGDRQRQTATRYGIGYYARTPYFWYTSPAGLEGEGAVITQDCGAEWHYTYDKSKRYPELSYATKKVAKTFGAKPFTNKLLSITDGALSFKSSNKKVAVVGKGGKVTVKGVGKTVITATSKSTAKRETYAWDGEAGSYIDYTHEAGKASYTLTVNPKGTSVKKLAKGKRSFTVSWKKPSKAALKQITGYQVKYSLKKSMKAAKTKTVKASSKAGKKCSLTVSKLKGGKKYYVQVRTYKKVGKTTYHSDWSKTKTVKTKK